MPEHFDRNRVALLLDTLAPKRRSRVVDVGANPISLPPYQPLQEMGGCEVWGFEPHPRQYAKLVKNATDNEHYLPYAVGDGQAGTFHRTRASGFSSLYKPNEEVSEGLGRFRWGMQVAETSAIETRRLDDLDELPAFDLLKIDIQGGEANVFENGARAMAQTLAVITEVSAIPLYEGQPLLDDQMRALRTQGFDLHKFLFFKELKIKSPRTERLRRGRFHSNQLVDGDAVFVRALFDHNSLGDEALKHLIILADAVFESFDRAAVLFGRLVDRGVVTETALSAYLDEVPFNKPAAAEATT